MVDTAGFNKIQHAAQMTQKAVEAGNWQSATTMWSYTEGVISQVTNNVDFYNILTKIRSYSFAGRIAPKPSIHNGTLSPLNYPNI